MSTHQYLWCSIISGSGKSTNRSRLFYELKKRQYKVEEVVEYAKELTYDENFIQLSNQILLLGKQFHPHFVLDKKVDYVITDSPFIMGITYMDKNLSYYQETKDLALSMNYSFNSLNFFIDRNHKYQEYGRNQTEQESDNKAIQIKDFLDDNNIQYHSVKSGEDFIKLALKLINLH